MRRPLILVVTIAALAAAACGPSATLAPGPTARPSVPPPSTGPATTPSARPSGSPAVSDLVFRVSQAGGFIAPSAELGTLPSVSVYADGMIVMVGPSRAADPAPALPDLEVEHVSPAGLATILDAAKSTGLADPAVSFDGGPAPDAGVTLITIHLGALPRIVRISALGDTSRDAGLDATVAAARVKLRAFLAEFDDLGTFVGPDLAVPVQPYEAPVLRLIVTAGDPSGGNGVAPIAWPLGTPLSSFGTEVASAASGGAAGLNGGAAARCGTVSGADQATVEALARTATVLTPWTSGGQSFGITFRPLLPDEAGCPGT